MLNFTKYPNIPDLTKNALILYVEEGRMPGSFLYAVLTDNLFDAIGSADAANMVALPNIVKFIYNEVPSGAWGSRDKVYTWVHYKFEPRPLKIKTK